MEPNVERKLAMIRSLRWWSADVLLTAARQWWSDQSAAARLPVAQWESLARCGAAAKTPEEYLSAIQDFFWYKKREGDQRERRGAVYRDWAQRGWGHVGLAESVFDAIKAAGVADQPSGFAKGLPALMSRFSEDSADCASLNSWRALSQMRDFIAALILIARTAALGRSHREDEVAGTGTEAIRP